MSFYSPSVEPLARCHICHGPVELEISKTDEHGQAVHEECYVESLNVSCQAPQSSSLRKPATGADFEWRNRMPAEATFRMQLRPDSRLVPSWLADVAVVVILATVSWFAYSNHSPVAVVKQSNALQEQQAAFVAKPQSAISAFKRIPVSPTETDYIADDVTVRHFARDPEIPRVQVAYKQVDFGDDVTVRYFASTDLQRRNRSLPRSAE